MLAFSWDTSQGPMLVLSGSADDHLRLRDALLALAAHPKSSGLKLRESGLLNNRSELEVAVRVTAQGDGARLLSNTEAVWLIKEHRLPDFAELLAVLAASDGPGHQYLDGDDGRLVVKASKDEYEVPTRG